MATKPTDKPTHATNLVANGPLGGDNRIDTPAALKDDGWDFPDFPKREHVNFLFHNIAEWVDYFEELTDEGDTLGNLFPREPSLEVGAFDFAVGAGNFRKAGTDQTVSDDIFTLSPSVTTYIVLNTDLSTITAVSSPFTSSQVVLWEVVTDGSGITSAVDLRLAPSDVLEKLAPIEVLATPFKRDEVLEVSAFDFAVAAGSYRNGTGDSAVTGVLFSITPSTTTFVVLNTSTGILEEASAPLTEDQVTLWEVTADGSDVTTVVDLRLAPDDSLERIAALEVATADTFTTIKNMSKLLDGDDLEGGQVWNRFALTAMHGSLTDFAVVSEEDNRLIMFRFDPVSATMSEIGSLAMEFGGVHNNMGMVSLTSTEVVIIADVDPTGAETKLYRWTEGTSSWAIISSVPHKTFTTHGVLSRFDNDTFVGRFEGSVASYDTPLLIYRRDGSDVWSQLGTEFDLEDLTPPVSSAPSITTLPGTTTILQATFDGAIRAFNYTEGTDTWIEVGTPIDLMGPVTNIPSISAISTTEAIFAVSAGAIDTDDRQEGVVQKIQLIGGVWTRVGEAFAPPYGVGVPWLSYHGNGEFTMFDTDSDLFRRCKIIEVLISV